MQCESQTVLHMNQSFLLFHFQWLRSVTVPLEKSLDDEVRVEPV